MVLVFCGCGDDPEPAPEVNSDASDSTGTEEPVEDVSEVFEDTTLSGVVRSATSFGPLGDAEVCLGDGDASCVRSDSEGRFSIEVPATYISLRVYLEDYRTSQVSLDASGDVLVTLPMVSEHFWNQQQESAGVGGESGLLTHFTYEDTPGLRVALGGVSVLLTPYAGVGALYDLGGAPTLGASTGDDGQGLFVDAWVGDYELIAIHPDGECRPLYGADVDADKVSVAPDAITIVAFNCVVVNDERVSLSGRVTSEQTGLAMPGVDVCWSTAGAGDSLCTESDNAGAYMLDNLPAHTKGELVVSSAGFYPSHTPLNTANGRVVPVVLSAAGVDRLTISQPFEPATQGIVVLNAYDADTVVEGDLESATPQGGVSIGLLPGAGLGPYYLVEPGLYSPIAPATFDAGVGVVLNLPAGTYLAKFEHPWGDCIPGNGLTPDTDGSFTFSVQPGVETQVVALCDADVPQTASILGRLQNSLIIPYEALDGGQMCVIEKDAATGTWEELQCDVVDANGDYELNNVPANTAIRLRASSQGYDTNDYPVNSRFGLTYYALLTPSVMKEYLLKPLWETGRCPPIEDINTYDGKGFLSARVYDAAYNTDTFYQGVWLGRAQMSVEPLDGSSPPVDALYFDTLIIDPKLDESSWAHGGMMVCSIEPGMYRVTWTHPWGECRAGSGNTSEPDGTFITEVRASSIISMGGVCDLDPPGTLVEELASYPPLASLNTTLEQLGMLEELSLDVAPETLTQAERVSIFAPSDAALAALLGDEGQLSEKALEQLLRHHMVQGELETHELVSGSPHWTMAGTPLSFVADPDGSIRIKGSSARLIELEHWALDGNVFVLDEVLELPEGFESTIESVNASASVAAEIGGLQLDHESWETGFVNTPSFTVYTPPGYYPEMAGGYPVVYLLHDVGGDDESLLGGWTMGEQPVGGLHAAMDSLVDSGAVAPMILVAINGMSQGYGSYFVDSKTPQSTQAFGDFDAYVTGIMAQVEESYHTSTSPDSPANRALLGVGMGGFGAVHIAAEHPIFSAVIIHSGLLSLADLLVPDEVVAATYPEGGVDGSLWSEVMAAWQAAYGSELLDGRLFDLVGPGQPAISRVASMASAFSPLKAFFAEFEQAGSTSLGLAQEMVTDIDGNPANNQDYPVYAVDTNLTSTVIDDTYIGFRLPWLADGTLDPLTWELWSAFEPLKAVEKAAEALKAADTDFYLDCGLNDERGFSDQAEAFLEGASPLLGGEQLTLSLYEGDHGALIYTERFYQSLLWLSALLDDEANPAP